MEHINVSATPIFTAKLILILNKSCSKRDLLVVIFIHHKMINLDSITNENNQKHKEKWPYIPDHPYRISIIGGSGSRKTNALINLINEKNDINKTYLYARDLSEPKYEYLIKKREDAGIKHVSSLNAFIECPNTMDDINENINDYNPIRKIKKKMFLTTWLQILQQIKHFRIQSKNCLLDAEN